MAKIPVMAVVVIILSPSSSLYLKSPNTERSFNRIFVSREEWGAQPPKSTSQMETPTPNVVIHHTDIPGACYNKEDCSRAMRSMQRTHQDFNKWADIGYNFGVGSDGLVYEGRGWDKVGAHAAGFNAQSLGIVLIGNWDSELPPKIQLSATKQLISEGVKLGWISPNYNLVGHRQVRDTECPGDALFEETSKWNHFNGTIDLVNTKSH